MEVGLLLSFIGASLLLILMPGPDNIFVLTESMTKGKAQGVYISIGLCLGILTHTLAAATGISILIQKSALAFSIIKYLGAAYLLYLAFMASREKAEPNMDLKGKAQLKELSKKSIQLKGQLIKKGLFMNVLNPKVSLFFLAFFPQFITKDGINITLQMLILGSIFMCQAFLIFGTLSILSSQFASYLNHSKFWQTTKKIKVIVLSVLGLSLAMSKK